MSDFAGRVALVTGASGAIGTALAWRLAQHGAAVGVGYHHDHESARRIVRRIESSGGQAAALGADLSEPGAPDELVEAAESKLGPVDLLLANAGVVKPLGIEDIDAEEFDRVMAVNLRAVYFASQAAARAMIADRKREPSRPRAKIVHIASLTSQIALPNIATYGTSRTAVVGLTRAMAVEWREHVSVNALAPGYVRTRQTEALFDDPAWVARTLGKIPMARFCELDDVVGFAVLLASSASDYMTGQVLYLDGGWLAAG